MLIQQMHIPTIADNNLRRIEFADIIKNKILHQVPNKIGAIVIGIDVPINEESA